MMIYTPKYMCKGCYITMRVQLEQNVRVDRLTGNTEQFSKIVPMNFSINQPITVSTETRKNSLHEWH